MTVESASQMNARIRRVNRELRIRAWVKANRDNLFAGILFALVVGDHLIVNSVWYSRWTEQKEARAVAEMKVTQMSSYTDGIVTLHLTGTRRNVAEVAGQFSAIAQ